MMLTSKKNNKALENLNEKLLQIMNNRGKVASDLLSPLSKITNPENTSQFKLVKDPNTNRVNDLLLHYTIPVTLYNILLTFRDTGEEFELRGDLLKLITNENYNVDFASSSDKKSMFDFAKKCISIKKLKVKKSTRDRSLIRLLRSPSLRISASGFSSSHKTKCLSSDLNDLCDRIKLLQQEKQAGNVSNIINEEIIATMGRLLVDRCISKNQHKFLIVKCSNYMKIMKLIEGS